MTDDDVIERMTQKFLSWRLPEDFNPDDGISFMPTFNECLPSGPMRRNPTGTNLFNYNQAKEMIRHLVATETI